jgi:uncharacterized protein DUF3352
MRTRLGVALLALLALLLVAACGGGGGSAKTPSAGGGSIPAGADFAPASAVGFVSAVTDADSSQWKAADDLLDKFPGRAQLIAQVEQALAKQQLNFERDIDPALGAEADLGILHFQGESGNVVGLTQPDDESKLEALLRKLAQGDEKPPVFRRLGDWTAVSDDQAVLDAAASAHAGTSLADAAMFKEAMGDLPGDALLRLWLDGPAITQQARQSTGGTGSLPGFGKLLSLAAAVTARSNGVAVSAVVKNDQAITAAKQYSSKLVSEVPAGALAYLSFSGLDRVINAIAGLPAVQRQLKDLEAQIGVSLAELTPLFAGEGALYVRQGIPLPEVTIVLEQANEAAARTTADKLFARLARALSGQVMTTTVSGVAAKQIKTENFSIYYAVFDGKLVVTDATTGISGLRDSGQKLTDDSVFNDARDAAGMPDETAGFLYVNLKDAIPLIENAISSFGGSEIDPTVRQNLDPLKSFLLYATVEGPKATIAGFVGVD